MAQSDVLREFFVSISYKLDESSERKFKQSVESATKLVAGMAAAVVAMAAAVEAAVVKVARDFDQIYWSTQRVGASAANVRAFGYALSQVGGSADAAQSSVEKFASSLRTNPGYQSWLKELGVSTSQGGKARDSIDEMIDLVDVLSKKYSGSRYGIGASIAAQFGIDENTYFQIINNRADFEKRFRESKGKNAAFGFDPDKAAASSRALMSELRDLASTLDTLKDRILIDLGPSLQDAIEKVNKWIVDHKDDIVRIINDLLEAVKNLAVKFGELVKAMQPVFDMFQKLAESITGEKGLQASFELFAEFIAGAWLMKILGAFAKVRLGWLQIAAIGGAAFGAQLNQLDNTANPLSSSVFGNSSWGQWAGNTWWGKGISGAVGIARTMFGGGPVKALTTDQQRANALAGYIQFRQAGLSHEAAIGILANISAESGFNPASRGDGGSAHGIAQWHGDRRAAILAGTGIDVSNASFGDQIKAVIWEMQNGGPQERDAYRRLQGAQTPEDAASIVSRFYERPFDVTGAAVDRMGRAADLKGQFSDADLKSDLVAPPSVTNSSSSTSNSLNSTVNLYGAYDKDTGSDIQRRVEGSWDLLMRNGQGAVR